MNLFGKAKGRRCQSDSKQMHFGKNRLYIKQVLRRDPTQLNCSSYVKWYFDQWGRRKPIPRVDGEYAADGPGGQLTSMQDYIREDLQLVYYDAAWLHGLDLSVDRIVGDKGGLSAEETKKFDLKAVYLAQCTESEPCTVDDVNRKLRRIVAELGGTSEMQKRLFEFCKGRDNVYEPNPDYPVSSRRSFVLASGAQPRPYQDTPAWNLCHETPGLDDAQNSGPAQIPIVGPWQGDFGWLWAYLRSVFGEFFKEIYVLSGGRKIFRRFLEWGERGFLIVVRTRAGEGGLWEGRGEQFFAKCVLLHQDGEVTIHK